MTTSLRHTSLSLALLAVATACHGASPPSDSSSTTVTTKTISMPVAATEAEKELAPRQYAQIRQMASLAERCEWLEPVDLAAVAAAAQERRAWLVWQGLDVDQAQAEADSLVADAGEIDCAGEQGQQLKGAVRYGAWQMRASWALRGQAMLPSDSRPAWFAGKTDLERFTTDLQEAVDGLLKIDTKSTETSQAMFNEQSEAMLAVRCVPSDSSCPAADLDAGFRTYAEEVIKQAESYADMLAQTEDKTGRPPQ